MNIGKAVTVIQNAAFRATIRLQLYTKNVNIATVFKSIYLYVRGNKAQKNSHMP